MQQAYLINRGGHEMLVPLQDLTEDELNAIVQQLHSEAAAYNRHADELHALCMLDEETRL